MSKLIGWILNSCYWLIKKKNTKPKSRNDASYNLVQWKIASLLLETSLAK